MGNDLEGALAQEQVRQDGELRALEVQSMRSALAVDILQMIVLPAFRRLAATLSPERYRVEVRDNSGPENPNPSVELKLSVPSGECPQRSYTLAVQYPGGDGLEIVQTIADLGDVCRYTQPFLEFSTDSCAGLGSRFVERVDACR
jgi:hypothetical protein